MSLDLLREFGYNPKEALEGNQWQQTYGQVSNPIVLREDDEFGAFEGASREETRQTPCERHSNAEILNSLGTPDTAADANNIWLEKGYPRTELTDRATEDIDYQDDDWGDFVDGPQKTPMQSEPYKRYLAKAEDYGVSLLQETQAANLSSIESAVKEETGRQITTERHAPAVQKAKLDTQTLPPSNIPPPSILLLLATTVLQSLPMEIKSLIASLKPMNSESHSEQSHLNEIKSRLSFSRAIARIIAGRRLRWKRDTHLAQSMKIAPAQAGKSGGMKLAGIDRMESRREDQEASEVVRVWKQHVGSLRSSVASLGTRFPGHTMLLPDIAENMPVRTANAGEGALTAPKSCILCGLKREERVQKVDVHVEDSFGEWWVDHWGHADCRLFWEANKNSLKQR